jgi:outer membrane protein OmpA-like peptidoglycan-associated protein
MRHKQSSGFRAENKRTRANRIHSPKLVGMSQPMTAGLTQFDVQAARLHDPRLSRQQRQEVAAHIGQLHGNRYLQRLMADRPAEQSPVTRPVALQRAPNQVQRFVRESDFPPAGKVDTSHPREFLVWNFGISKGALKEEHKAEMPRLAEEVNKTLSRDDNWEVDVEGQASSSGTDTVNEPLARARAEATKKGLVDAGVAESKIKVTSTGESKAQPAVTAEGMARSRAARIILVPRMAGPQPNAPADFPKADDPACQVQDGFLNLSGGSVKEDRSPGQYVIRAGGPEEPGMDFGGSAYVDAPPGSKFPRIPYPKSCGELQYVQNVQPFIEFVYKDGSRARKESRQWCLDTEDPYPSQKMIFLAANDSPAVGTGRVGTLEKTEGLINTVETRSVFKMFLMVKPKKGDRQALFVGYWTFVGQARNPTTEMGKGQLALDSSVSRVIPASGKGEKSAEVPATTPNVKDIPFVVDRGGLTGSKTFADLFARVLNPANKEAEAET